MVIPQDAPFWTPLSDGSIMKIQRAIRPLCYALLIAFFLPNTQQFLGRFSPHFREKNEPAPAMRKWWGWKPSPMHAALVFLLLLIVTLEINRGGEFIYFQF